MQQNIKKYQKILLFFSSEAYFEKNTKERMIVQIKKNVSLVYSFLHVIIFFTSEKSITSMLGGDIKS